MGESVDVPALRRAPAGVVQVVLGGHGGGAGRGAATPRVGSTLRQRHRDGVRQRLKNILSAKVFYSYNAFVLVSFFLLLRHPTHSLRRGYSVATIPAPVDYIVSYYANPRGGGILL